MNLVYKLLVCVACGCCIVSATQVLDENGRCVYWFYNDDPQGHNPCASDDGNIIYVPESTYFIYLNDGAKDE